MGLQKVKCKYICVPGLVHSFVTFRALKTLTQLQLKEKTGRTILTTRDCNESNELVLFSELSKYSATSLVTLPNKLFQ